MVNIKKWGKEEEEEGVNKKGIGFPEEEIRSKHENEEEVLGRE